MIRVFISSMVLFISVIHGVAAENGKTTALDSWPQWRGPLGTGFAPAADPPIEWSEEKNVRWKLPLQGQGHSTPVVWGEDVFVTSAKPSGEALEPRHDTAHGAHDGVPVTHYHDFTVIAIRRSTGEIKWHKTVHREFPHEGGHFTASLASNSPVTDGEHVFAFFGSRGLYCLDLNGELRWQTDLGEMQTKHAHGEGSSPALHGETLVINWDHEGQSFIVAFDKRTGEQRWKTLRDEVTSWATPIIVDYSGRPQVVASGTDRVRGYDLETGEVIWECGELSANVVASPVFADGIVYAGSSYEKRVMLAIDLKGASGDLTGTGHVLWRRVRGAPYVPSPLLFDGSLYFLRHYQGILTRADPKTGEDQGGPFRLEGILNVYASPVAVADRIYVTDLDGKTLVLSHEEKPVVLAYNALEDNFSASAAIAGKDLFLRGHENLYCLFAD
jgi:outer membrane protein assembly factor BamB